MAHVIKDGTGAGYNAKVSVDNHLAVNAVSVEEVTHISSLDERAYHFHLERTLVAANTEENVGIITYTGDNKLQIWGISVSKEDVALDSGAQAVFEVVSGAAYTSGGDAVTPINLNLGSPNQPDNVAYSGTTTLVLDTSSEAEIFDVATEHPFTIEFRGSLILTKGDSVAIKGKSKNIGDKLHVLVTAFEVTEAI